MNQFANKQLTSEQENRCKNLLDVALSGFLKKNPTDVQAAADFSIKVGRSIIASVLKSSEKVDGAKRDSRTKAVDELAALNNVKFIHRREIEEVEDLIGFEQVSKTTYEELYAVTKQNATLGGASLAYVYRLDEKNNLFMVYSTAFCRNDENFDPLIGKEESLKKFLAGDTLEVQVTHERLGPVKLAQLVNEYKHVENAKLEALKDKAATQ